MKVLVNNKKQNEGLLSNAFSLKDVVTQVFSTCKKMEGETAFLNDVPDGLFLYNDPRLVGSVLNSLVSSIIKETPGRAIRIAAKIYTNIILLHIKQECEEQTNVSMNELQTLALQINGIVNITSFRANITTFAFSFPNTQPVN